MCVVCFSYRKVSAMPGIARSKSVIQLLENITCMILLVKCKNLIKIPPPLKIN